MALSDNLVAYWSLEEASGTRLDAHGSNDLTEVNGVSNVTGKVGNAATFNGSNDYLNIASNADLQMGNIDFSIAYWFRASTVSNPRGHVAKVSAASGTTWEYYCRTNGTELQFNISDGTTSASAVSTIANTTWYFVAAIHDSVNDELRLYVDGSLAATTAWANGGLVSTGDFALGARPATSYAHFFGGDLDEVGLWKRALTPTEITDLYNSGNGRDYAYVSAGGGGIEGTATVTLGALTSTATGELSITGATDATLGSATLSSTGKLAIVGESSSTLGALTLTATGALSIAGVTGVTLGALTVTSSGVLALQGQAVIDLGTLTLTGVGVAVLAVAVVGSVQGVSSNGAVVGVSVVGSVTGTQSTGVI